LGQMRERRARSAEAYSMYVAGVGGRSLTKQMVRRRRRYQGEGASLSFELRVVSFELGVLMTPCVAEGGAFRKPEGRGDAKGRAEESRGNFKF
jgi:hypothetical protein